MSGRARARYSLGFETEDGRQTAGFVLAASLLPALSLWRGGVSPSGIFIVLVGAVVALLLTRQMPAFGRPVPLGLMPLGLAAIACTVAVLPLPLGLIRAVSPLLTEARCDVWEDLGHSCAWVPLAADRAATALDAARLLVAFVLALIVSARAQSGRSVLWVWNALGVSAGLHLLVSQPNLELRRFGAFVSENHQAAFFNIGWACALLKAWVSRGHERRAYGLLMLACFAGTLLTMSRGGVSAALLGLLLLGVLMVRSWSRRTVAVLAGASVILGFLGFALWPQLARAFFVQSPLEKLDIYAPTIDLISRYPFGVGRGGFQWVFNMHRPAQRFWLQHDFVENEYLQSFVDYGWFGGAFCCVVLLVLLRTTFTLALPRQDGGFDAHRPKAVITFVVLAMLAVQNLVDFNAQLLVVFGSVWLCVAALGRPSVPLLSVSAFNKPWKGLHAKAMASLALALCVPLLAWGWYFDGRRLERTPDAESLKRLLYARPTDAAALAALGRADPEHRMSWLNHALAIDPMYGKAHIEVATLLCDASATKQAFSELRRALLAEPNMTADASRVIAKCRAQPSDYVALVAPEFAPRLLHFALAEADGAARAELAEAVIDYSSAVAAGTVNPLFQALARAVRSEPAWERIRQAWQAVAPDDPFLALELADVALERRNPDQALAALSSLKSPRPSVVAMREVDLLWKLERYSEADEKNANVVRDCEREPEVCVLFHAHRARSFERQERYQEALFEYRLVLLRHPQDISAALGAARALLRVGERQEARELLRSVLAKTNDASVFTLLRSIEAQSSESERLIERMKRQ